VHREVDDESEARVEVPAVKWHGEWNLCWLASFPVDDPRHEDVHRDEEQEEVRDGKSGPAFDERPGPDKLGGHAGNGPAALDQMDGHQADEYEADDSVIIDLDVQKLQRAERGRGRAQQTEMDCPPGSGAPYRPAVMQLLERCSGLRHNHPTCATGRSYSIGRLEIPVGSRPASTQPTTAAATGMAITMRNRLLQGMWSMMSDSPPSSAFEWNHPASPT